MQGMWITLLNFVRPKLTEQYPENRGKHVYFDRFRAMLTMPHDENNHHKCTGCGICMNNCPNGTIEVITKSEVDPETGKAKRVIDKHLYDVGSCIFCDLCVQTCPFDAIEFSNQFEHSVFTKELLLKQLNRPGSSLKPKPAPAPKPVDTAAPKPAEAPAPKPAEAPAPAKTDAENKGTNTQTA